MKKQSLYNSLLIVLLFLAACKKTVNEPEVDYVQFEGKAYVIGSNLPPKSLPLKLYVYKDTLMPTGLTVEIIDSLYTDNLGNFSYKLYPYKDTESFAIRAPYHPMYSTSDILIASKLGVFKKDIGILAVAPVTLELENDHFSPTDTLFLLDPKGEFIYYESPFKVNRIFTSRYWAYDNLDFHFRLIRNDIDSNWTMRLNLIEDSTYYFKIKY
jgi:hypothetical protein